MPSTCRRGHNGDRLRAHRSTGLSVNAPACRPGCRGGQMRIAVMGAGGVGGFYGAKLAEEGHDVVVIEQNGSAWCRERVGQYGWISVGGGGLKKKSTNISMLTII